MKLLNYKQLSEELGLSIRYIQLCIQNQGLPAIYFGRSVRFDPQQIAEWVYSQRNQKPNIQVNKEVA